MIGCYWVFYCINSNGRAPSEVFSKDYRTGGTVRADTLTEAERRWRTEFSIKPSAGGRRDLLVGDVLRDLTDRYWIRTPTRWAEVVFRISGGGE